MEKKINICIDFNRLKPLSRWHHDRLYTNNLFKDDRFCFSQWKDLKNGENNFLFLYCVPDETMQFLESMSDDFYDIIKEKNIKFLFYNEQFNLFMFDGNIFQYVPEIKNNCYDINDILYWKITNLLKSHEIEEKNLFFIHSAKGFLQEIEQMKTRKILWINSTLDIKSKHIQAQPWLMRLSQEKKIANKKNFQYHYACLFAGRPAKHRHLLINKLYEKNLLKFGKCSLAPYPDLADANQLPFDDLPSIGRPNSHFLDKYFEFDIFEDILIWVAAETYCPNGYPHFTEKTVKAILYERPFISYGNPGTLAYLRDYGFKTFGSFWNESYDDEKDDDKKIEMIADIILEVCKKNKSELNQMYDDMRPILDYNKNLLINTDWREGLIKFLR